MQTGEDFLIFQDREDILWGQRWQATIDGTLDSTTFLIPVITPAFFRSPACRQEVEKFLRREANLGRDDLILPIYYVDTVALTDASDSLAVQLAGRQYVDWRPLRFVSLDDPAARQELARLAGHIVAALHREHAVRPATSGTDEQVEDEENAPGFVELVAEAEDAFPLLTNVVDEFAIQLRAISEIAESSGAEMQVANTTARPASARLSILGRMADTLDEPVKTMEDLADDYVEQLSRVDGGITAMAQRVPHLDEPEEVSAAVELHGKLDELASNAAEGLGQLERLAEIVQDTGQLSRNIRPVFRRIRRAVQKVASSKDTIVGWKEEFARQLAARDDQ
jgi:hypothetical protein